LKQGLGLVDLLRRAFAGHLHDGAAQPRGLDEQAGHLAWLVRHRFPGRAGGLRVVLDVLAPLVGEPERALATGLIGLDQALVGELGQGRVDRSRAGPPGAVAALLDLGHDLVAVARALEQQGQYRGAHVAAARLRPAGRAGWPPWPPSAPSAGAARSAVPLPRTLRPGAPPVPRPAARAVAVPGRHLPDRAADLSEQSLEGLADPGIEPPGRGLCCWHLTLPGDHSRHAHDISIVLAKTRHYSMPNLASAPRWPQPLRRRP